MDIDLENILAKLSENQNLTKIITPEDMQRMIENSRAAEAWKANDERNKIGYVDVGNLPQDEATQILNHAIKTHEETRLKYHNVVIALERRSYTLEEFDSMLDEIVMNTVIENFKMNKFDISKLNITIDLDKTSIKFSVPETKEYAEFLRLKAIYDPVG